MQYLETIKALDGELYNLKYHQKRLDETIKNSNIILKDIVLPPASGLFRCRVVYDAKNYEVTYHPYKKKNIKTLKLVCDDEISYARKYCERSAIDVLMQKKSFCDDILIVKNGLVTDTSIANIAFKYKNNWLTPKKPLLAGTTRARLLQNHKIVEEDISVKDLENFTQVALMNAMIDFDIIPNENIREIIC
ncbi:aminotransferase class IV family protein [Sulfurimonas sp.]